ncbi:MAG: cation:proton antiporter regulatory subunit [Pseudomonadales bacterium]
MYIPEGSKFEGKTIQETELAEREINVLTLYRGPTIIPNPRQKRVIEAGDKLLCYGKLNAMRDLIPAKTRKRRRPQIQVLEHSEVPGEEPGLGSDDDA